MGLCHANRKHYRGTLELTCYIQGYMLLLCCMLQSYSVTVKNLPAIITSWQGIQADAGV